MIMIGLGVILLLLGIYFSVVEGEGFILFFTVLFGGIVWTCANLALGAIFDERHLAYSAPLEQIDGMDYYLINDYPFIAQYDVDREDGRRPEGDISWDIHYGDENRVDIYEHDALGWLSVEMDQNFTEFIVTVTDDSLVYTP